MIEEQMHIKIPTFQQVFKRNSIVAHANWMKIWQIWWTCPLTGATCCLCCCSTLSNDLLTYFTQSACNVSCRQLATKNMTHVPTCASVASNIRKVPVNQQKKKESKQCQQSTYSFTWCFYNVYIITITLFFYYRINDLIPLVVIN